MADVAGDIRIRTCIVTGSAAASSDLNASAVNWLGRAPQDRAGPILFWRVVKTQTVAGRSSIPAAKQHPAGA